SVLNTVRRSKVGRLIAFSTSAVAAWCASASFNSRVFAASWAEADGAFLRPAVFVFEAPVRVRTPRLGPLALDSPRLILCRPGQCGSSANLAHLFTRAHRSPCDLRHTHLHDNLNPMRRVYYGAAHRCTTCHPQRGRPPTSL